MKSLVNLRFLRAFDHLPPETQRNARKAYRLWKEDPRHPSLHFKKTGKVWSVRVDEAYRALGHLVDDTMHWFWIGGHDDYEQLIRNAPKAPKSGPGDSER